MFDHMHKRLQVFVLLVQTSGAPAGGAEVILTKKKLNSRVEILRWQLTSQLILEFGLIGF